MPSWLSLNNFELGTAGAADAGTRADDAVVDWLGLGDTFVGDLARANNTYFAPYVYAKQVGADPSASYSRTIENAAEHGATRDQLERMAYGAGVVAENNGALSKAAGMTADQVGGGIKTGLLVAGVVAGVALLAYASFQVAAAAKVLKA